MKKFQSKDGVVIENIVEYVRNWINENKNSDIYIGCDSQETYAKITYVTTICLYQQGKGAHVIYCKEHELKTNKGKTNMHTRLWAEVTKSIEVADSLKDLERRITVHVDYNSKENEKSNQLYEAGIGYAKSMGYDAVGKPDAWAASSAADNYCR
jgi:predicted RNase H-related nuclease YkuK (DUF458 family)